MLKLKTSRAGRPSAYSDTTADEICERLTDGESLRQICRDEHMPDKATIFRWLNDERFRGFRDRYAHAREAQADALFDELVEIADDTGELDDNVKVQRARLQIDTRKWVASRLAPKKSSETNKIEHEVSRVTFTQAQRDAAVAAALAADT